MKLPVLLTGSIVRKDQCLLQWKTARPPQIQDNTKRSHGVMQQWTGGYDGQLLDDTATNTSDEFRVLNVTQPNNDVSVLWTYTCCQHSRKSK
jgi:hypothetical protein